MEKLIIKAVISNDLSYPQVPTCQHMSVAQIAKEAKDAYDEGASVVHFHEPWFRGKAMGIPGCKEASAAIRAACPVLIEGHTVEELQNGIPELMVIQPGVIDHTEPDEKTGYYKDEDMDRKPFVRTRREVMNVCIGYRDHGVKPRLESFGVPNTFRNIMWLIYKKAIDPPYLLTWNFGMGGIVGDAATPEYLHQRMAACPEAIKKDVVAEVSVYNSGAPRLILHTLAIAEGLHIRVGCEDNPYYWEKQICKGNAELVARVARIAKEYHRDIATPEDARKIYKLPKPRK